MVVAPQINNNSKVNDPVEVGNNLDVEEDKETNKDRHKTNNREEGLPLDTKRDHQMDKDSKDHLQGKDNNKDHLQGKVNKDGLNNKDNPVRLQDMDNKDLNNKDNPNLILDSSSSKKVVVNNKADGVAIMVNNVLLLIEVPKIDNPNQINSNVKIPNQTITAPSQ
jgi:hypothetical protein